MSIPWTAAKYGKLHCTDCQVTFKRGKSCECDPDEVAPGPVESGSRPYVTYVKTGKQDGAILLTRDGILSRLADLACKFRHKNGIEEKLDLDCAAEERKTLGTLLDAISDDEEEAKLQQLEERLRELQDAVDRKQGGVMRTSELPAGALEN